MIHEPNPPSKTVVRDVRPPKNVQTIAYREPLRASANGSRGERLKLERLKQSVSARGTHQRPASPTTRSGGSCSATRVKTSEYLNLEAGEGERTSVGYWEFYRIIMSHRNARWHDGARRE